MRVLYNLVTLVAVCFLTTGCSALFGNSDQVQYSQYIGGYWGRWHTLPDWEFYGTPDNFVVFRHGRHPSEFTFRLKVNQLNPHLVNKDNWQDFTGSVEFTTEMPTSYTDGSKWFIDNELPYLFHGRYSRTRPARIRIIKQGRLFCYNVYIDDVGFAITIPWKEKK